tara:strand:- start:143 stop:301 length:159 start_codon:yes stop_codon:yes gene_type:complete
MIMITLGFFFSGFKMELYENAKQTNEMKLSDSAGSIIFFVKIIYSGFAVFKA